MAKYFGTDGIRGLAGTGFFTPQNLLDLGRALGQFIGPGKTVFIAKDTRQSGDMMQAAIAAGLTSEGANVCVLGVLPTPAVSFLTPTKGGDLGIMLTASHNPHRDNGIKLFGSDGAKLSSDSQDEIEILFERVRQAPKDITSFGVISSMGSAEETYITHVLSSLPEGFNLHGTKIVLDLAHGAAAFVGPKLFDRLGADITLIGDQPTGININEACGSTAPTLLSDTVLSKGADLGVALDGDADRLICVDEMGVVIDGDQLLAILARHSLNTHTLKSRSVVSTIMSNLGLELWVNAQGLSLERTKVGDKHVAEKMRATGANLGGEQSGHMILSDFAATGDGLLASLQVLAAFSANTQPMSAFARVFDPVPQKLVNIPFDGPDPLRNASVISAIEAMKAEYGSLAHIVVRKSGTESLIRIMAQATDPAMVDEIIAKATEILGTN